MTKFKLGMNTYFAVKRWPEPEMWMKMVKKDFGLDVAQFDLDLLDPRTTEPARSMQAQKIKENAEKYKVKIQGAFTGGVGYHQSLLLHPHYEMRVDALDWFLNGVIIAQKIGAESFGAIYGALSVADFADEKKKNHLITELKYALHVIAKSAKAAGLKYILIEPSPVPREIPSSLDEAIRLYDFFNEDSPLPIEYLFDVGHACSYLAKDNESDPYLWIRKIGKLCKAIHLQQTNGKGDCHWSFTKENNKMGIIDAKKVIDTVASTGAKEMYLIFELVHAFEAYEPNVFDQVRESVEYWQKALSK